MSRRPRLLLDNECNGENDRHTLVAPHYLPPLAAGVVSNVENFDPNAGHET